MPGWFDALEVSLTDFFRAMLLKNQVKSSLLAKSRHSKVQIGCQI